jgi:hypothetical protein
VPNKREKKKLKSIVLSDDDDGDVGEDIASVPTRGGRSQKAVIDHVYDLEDDDTPRIILMHDPPHLMMQGMITSSSSSSSDWSRNGGAAAASTEALGMLIASFRDPVVIIVSDVSGKDDFFFASERCLPPTVRDRYAHHHRFVSVYLCMYVCMYIFVVV